MERNSQKKLRMKERERWYGCFLLCDCLDCVSVARFSSAFLLPLFYFFKP